MNSKNARVVLSLMDHLLPFYPVSKLKGRVRKSKRINQFRSGREEWEKIGKRCKNKKGLSNFEMEGKSWRKSGRDDAQSKEEDLKTARQETFYRLAILGDRSEEATPSSSPDSRTTPNEGF